MKKILTSILALSLLLNVFALSSCSKKEEPEITEPSKERPSKPIQTTAPIETTKEPDILAAPELSQVHAICELATLECYFHNVAQATKPAGTGAIHMGESDRDFWVEYTATARIGINVNDVDMVIDGDTIYITMPEATIVGDITADSNSYVITESPDCVDLLHQNPNEITANDYSTAVNQSVGELREDIMNDDMLLMTAQNRARDLIENYIENLAALSGTEYTIVWQTAGDNLA